MARGTAVRMGLGWMETLGLIWMGLLAGWADLTGRGGREEMGLKGRTEPGYFANEKQVDYWTAEFLYASRTSLNKAESVRLLYECINYIKLGLKI